jgi:anti-anti-sigma factor
MDIQTRMLDASQNLVEMALNGRLDAYTSQAVKVRLHEIIDEIASAVIINLAEVYFIDSSGLSALVSGLRVAREKDKDLLLVGLSKQAKMVFKLTMLDRIFVTYETVEDALDNLPDQLSS